MQLLSELLDTLMRFISGWSELLIIKIHEATLAGTLGTLLVALLLTVLTLYLSQGALYLFQKVLEVSRLLLKVVALLVMVVMVLTGIRYVWDGVKSYHRTCTGAFFEKIMPCKPLDLTPRPETNMETKNTLAVKKARNAVKSLAKEKTKTRKPHKEP